MAFHHRDLWDTRHLQRRLAARSFSEAGAFAYFLAIMAFDWLQFTQARLYPAPVPVAEWLRVDALFTLGITLLGLLFLFLRNGGTAGKDFLYRYFPLAFVVGWKFFVFATLAMACCHWLTLGMPHVQRGWITSGLIALCNLAMFLRIGQHMKALAIAKEL